MIKREVLTGLFLGLIGNSIGITIIAFVISILKKANFLALIERYYIGGNFWMLICLGAMVNLALFFWFLQKDMFYRARGVLLATFIAAITSYIIYFI